MEIFESIGFINFYGFSPCFDILQEIKDQEGEKNVLLVGSGDLGYILKSQADNLERKVNYYVYEKQKECFVRELLLLLVVNCKSLNYRERCELYLDIYGNHMIRKKSQEFIDASIKELIALVTDAKNSKLGIKHILDFSMIKYKDIDDIVQILYSYSSKVDFKMEEFRDKRLRRHYKEKYDFRVNQVDWDYQMEIIPNTKIIHWIHYKDWRQQGIAFEFRFEKYIEANRTMSSYIPAKHKNSDEKYKNGTSCMVRGFWGDIVISPYVAYGTETEYSPEKEWMFRTINMSMASTALEVSTFQILYWLKMLQQSTPHRAPIDNPYISQQQKEQINQSDLINNNMNTIKEENEDQNEQQDDSNVLLHQNNQSHSYYDFSQILDAFQNIKIIPIFEDLEKIGEKKKFQQIIDLCFVSFYFSNSIQNAGLNKLIKNQGLLYFENTKYILGLTKEKKQQLDETIVQLAKEQQYTHQQSQKSYLIKFQKNL